MLILKFCLLSSFSLRGSLGLSETEAQLQCLDTLLAPSQVRESKHLLFFMICFSMCCLLVSRNHSIACSFGHLKTLLFTKRKAHKIKATEIGENCLFHSEYTGNDPQSQNQSLKANVKGFTLIFRSRLTPRICIFLIARGFLNRSSKSSCFFSFSFCPVHVKAAKKQRKRAGWRSCRQRMEPGDALASGSSEFGAAGR